MFLSLLALNPRSRQVQAELRDLYQMHRTLSKAFGDEKGEWDAARVLFRVDEVNGKLSALVQSKTLPDWSRLTVSDDYLADDPMMKAFNPSVQDGQILHFKLRANPTVKRNGKREGLYKEAEQHDWLRKKGVRCGFTVLDAVAKSDGKKTSLTAEGHGTVLLAVVFDGVLKVTDPAKFLEALESGIGSAKGFGFGLLSVAPIKR